MIRRSICGRKLKRLKGLAEIAQRLKKEGYKILLCHGVFDLIHPGHIRYFEQASKHDKDILLVTVTRDEHVNKGPGRPVFNQNLRCESVAALACVDYVALSNHPTAVEAIEKIKPDFYVKGADYKNLSDDVTGGIHKEIEAVKAAGGKFRVVEEPTLSSTQLLNAHFSVYGEEAEKFLQGFRKKYSSEEILEDLKSLKGLRVLVLGEAIIDEYCYCSPVGKSPKEVMFTAKFEWEESFAGGALACANHVAGFCDTVDLVTCLGTQNSQEALIRSKLKPNIRPKFFYRDDSCTIVKRRFVEPVFLNKMLQVCFLNDQAINENLEEEISDTLRKMLPEYNLVLVTDYGHGLIGKKTVETLCRHAKFLAVNTQTNSLNQGYNMIFKYPRSDYICLDDPEIRLAAKNRDGNMEAIIREVSEKMECDLVSVTHGPHGSVNYDKKFGFSKVPALSKKIVDRMGAGDAYLSITAPCTAKGISADKVGFIGNAAGAMAVGYVGNKNSIEPVPLAKFIQALLR